MNPLRHLNLGPRLTLVIGLILALLLGMSTAALIALADIEETTTSLTETDWAKARDAALADSLTNTNARRTMELFFAPDSGRAEQLRQAILRNKMEITAALESLEARNTSEQGRALLDAVKARRAQFVASFSRVDALLSTGSRDDAAQELLQTTLPAIDELQAAMQALTSFQGQVAEERGVVVRQDVEHSRQILWACSVAAALTGVLFGWLLVRSITLPIGQAVALANQVADGDLAARATITSRDEPGQLLLALNQMADSLLRTVGAVRQGSESIATASSQIATGNADLSQRTESQASSLQQTAASMEQLTGTVRSNAEAARMASQLANSTNSTAQEGNVAVGKAQATMADICAATRRIATITDVIDGIAFQTNILALNASVEAARAGSQGRGFAVVAGEVRGLAHRSAEAAREIKALIADSEAKVASGSTLVSEAGRTMGDISTRVQQVSELIDGISAATAEQSLGIGQVGAAVTHLDRATQQNAALVEESAAAAESLSDQAARLVQAVRMFRCEAAA